MRYVLSWHTRDAELRERSPAWHEEAAAFLARLEGELNAHSELDSTLVLAPDALASVLGPGHERREGHYNSEAKPVARLWVIRTSGRERAEAIAAELAGELDTWIEVREVLEGAQRP